MNSSSQVATLPASLRFRIVVICSVIVATGTIAVATFLSSTKWTQDGWTRNDILLAKGVEFDGAAGSESSRSDETLWVATLPDVVVQHMVQMMNGSRKRHYDAEHDTMQGIQAMNEMVCVLVCVYSPRSDPYKDFLFGMFNRQNYMGPKRLFLFWNGDASEQLAKWKESVARQSDHVHFNWLPVGANLKLGAKRNKLVQIALQWHEHEKQRCQYFMNWDDDDFYSETYLRTVVAAFRAQPLAVLAQLPIFGLLEFSPHGADGDEKWARATEAKTFEEYGQKNIYQFGLQSQLAPGSYGWMFSFTRAFFDEWEGRYGHGYDRSEENTMWYNFKVNVNNKKGKCIDNLVVTIPQTNAPGSMIAVHIDMNQGTYKKECPLVHKDDGFQDDEGRSEAFREKLESAALGTHLAGRHRDVNFIMSGHPIIVPYLSQLGVCKRQAEDHDEIAHFTSLLLLQ